MSGSSLNRQELLRDSQSTLREIAGILGDLWDIQDLQKFIEPTGNSVLIAHGGGGDPSYVLRSTHREVLALQEGIGALQDLLPHAIVQAGCRPPVGLRPETPVVEWPTRASKILNEVQGRLDRLAHEFEHQGVSPE